MSLENACSDLMSRVFECGSNVWCRDVFYTYNINWDFGRSQIFASLLIYVFFFPRVLPVFRVAFDCVFLIHVVSKGLCFLLDFNSIVIACFICFAFHGLLPMVEGWCAVQKVSFYFRVGHRYWLCSRNHFLGQIVQFFLCASMYFLFCVHHLHGHCVCVSCCDFGVVFIHLAGYFRFLEFSSIFGVRTVLVLVCSSTSVWLRFQISLCRVGIWLFLIHARGRLVFQVLLFPCVFIRLWLFTDFFFIPLLSAVSAYMSISFTPVALDGR